MTNNIDNVYEDGSGAPAVIEVQGWKWACDFLGEVKCRLITQSSSRKPPKWMADYVRHAYLDELTLRVSQEWLALNRKMYSK